MGNLAPMPDGYGGSRDFGNAFATFAGTDMKIWIADQPIGSLMSLSVSVVRDVVPIYTMASVDPRAFAKGKRSITGTMSFAMFDRHALLDGAFPTLSRTESLGSRYVALEDGDPAVTWTSEATELAKFVSDSDFWAEKGTLNYSDQLPPFDITVTMKNEYGDGATFVVRYVVIVNEGFGITVDDVSQSMACNFIAKKLSKLTPMRRGKTVYHSYQMLGGGKAQDLRTGMSG